MGNWLDDVIGDVVDGIHEIPDQMGDALGIWDEDDEQEENED